jgi:hypothetical protein
MNKLAVCVVGLSLCSAANASITWDGARLIRSGLAEWYDDIGGNGVSNIYFAADDTLLYTGNTASPDTHWLSESLDAPGVYKYTFFASNNLGNTGVTIYDLELNFNGSAQPLIQASTTSDYTGGASFTDGVNQVAVTLFSFDILPLGAGGVDEVANWDSSPDGAEDIVGRLQLTVTRVPAPASAVLLGIGLIGFRRSRR